MSSVTPLTTQRHAHRNSSQKCKSTTACWSSCAMKQRSSKATVGNTCICLLSARKGSKAGHSTLRWRSSSIAPAPVRPLVHQSQFRSRQGTHCPRPWASNYAQRVTRSVWRHTSGLSVVSLWCASSDWNVLICKSLVLVVHQSC